MTDIQEDFRYTAFISYCHHSEPDKTIAKRLHAELENYRVPPQLVRGKNCPKRIGLVFRDVDELSASKDLDASLVEALQASRFLIVICSPRAVSSKWIEREIEIFKRLGRSNEQILPLLIEGEPKESFPSSLFDRRIDPVTGQEIEIQPLAGNIKADSLKESLRLLKEEKLRLMAQILGCRFDDLKQREHERELERLRKNAAIASFLVVVFACIAGIAWHQRNQAQENYLKASNAADTLVTEVARAVEPIAGTQVKTVGGILSSADSVFKKLLLTDQPAETRAGQGRMENQFAGLFLSMNKSGEAKRSAETAIGIFRQLAKKFPQNPDYRLQLATGLNWLGRVDATQGRPSTALAHHQEAKSLLDNLLTHEPNHAEYQEEQAVSLTNLGFLYADRQDRTMALKSFEQAVAVRSGLVEVNPDNANAVRLLAKARLGLANTVGEQGNAEKSFALLQQAVDELRGLSDQNRDDARFQEGLADAWLALGYGHKKVNRTFKADEAFEQARLIAERLAALDPGNKNRRNLLLRCQLSIADLNRQGNSIAALMQQLRISDKQIVIAQDLSKEDPANVLHQGLLMTMQGQRGLALHALARQGIEHTANILAAAEAFNKALKLGQPFLSNTDLGLVPWILPSSVDHMGLNQVLSDMMRSAEAMRHHISSFEIPLDVYTRLSQANPDEMEWVRERAKYLWLLAGALYNAVQAGLMPRENFERAAHNLEEAFPLYDRLLAGDPQNTKDLDDYKTAISVLEIIQLEKGDEAAADTTHQKAELVQQRLDRLPRDESHYSGSGLSSQAIDILFGGIGADPEKRRITIEHFLATMEDSLIHPIKKSLFDVPDQILSSISHLDSNDPEQNTQARAFLERGIKALQAALLPPTQQDIKQQKKLPEFFYPDDDELVNVRKKQLAAYEKTLADLPTREQIENLEQQRLLASASDTLTDWRNSDKLTSDQIAALRPIVNTATPPVPQAQPVDAKNLDPELLERVRADLESTTDTDPHQDVRRQDLILVLQQLAGYYAIKGDSAKAEDYLARAQTLMAETAGKGANPADETMTLAEQFTTSATQKGMAGDLDGAIDDIRKAIEIMEKLRKESPSKSAVGMDRLGLDLGLAYSNQSYLLMLKRQFHEALESTNTSLDFNSTVADFALNRVFALVFNDSIEEALRIVNEFEGQKTLDGRPFKKAVRDSITEFRAKGIEHKDFVRLKKVLGP